MISMKTRGIVEDASVLAVTSACICTQALELPRPG